MFKSGSQPQSSTAAPPRDATYERHKLRMAKKSREKASSAREIADTFPKLRARPRKQRAAALESLAVWCRSYFPEVFDLPFSSDHHRVIGAIERAVTTGGLFALAMPRGSGKSALCQAAVMWAAMRGSVKFSLLVGASKDAACEILASIKMQLETNDHLLADFPEICWPIRKLEGINQRKLLFQAQPIKMKFTADRISLPNLPKSAGAGATICVAGLTGRIRGRKVTLHDGREVRPSLVILDDPQDDESATSPSQTAARERVIKGSVLGLAGPGKKIAAVCPCTVIAPDDLADRLLDRQRNPEWSGIRTSMVRKWPDGEKAESLWAEYRAIQEKAFRDEAGPEAENEFYVANRAAMDHGSEVAWPERFSSTEVSALQHAYNLRYRDPDSFDAEYQNKPRRHAEDESQTLQARHLVSRINGLPRRSVPIGAQYLTVFVDVQAQALFWTATAWTEDFVGTVADYGAWPKQPGGYWTLAKIRKTLDSRYPGQTLESKLASGLTDLAVELQSAEWTRPDGAKLSISRTLVDANWGASTDTVYRWAAGPSGQSIAAIPSHGRFVGASSNPMNDWAKKPGDLVGTSWKVPALAPGRQIRHCVWDTNHWKTFVAGRLLMPIAAPGSLTLFGTESDDHRMFADHLCAEFRVPTTARGRTVDEWKQRPNQPDNHWWDCLVGTAVAASLSGARVATPGTDQPAKPRRRRGVKYA